MAEAAVDEEKSEVEKPEATGERSYPSLSLKIWPPTQRTRDAVVQRLVETLTSQSVLSNRYGLFPEDEAAVSARLIEDEAFSAGISAASASGTDYDEIELLRVYSQEISRRMVESAKARASAASAATES